MKSRAGSAFLVDPLNTDEIADGMRLLAHMGQEERQARPPELRLSIARISRNLAEATWRSTLQQRAVIVRATVFTRVLPQSRAQGSSCTQVPCICRDEDVQEAVFWPDRADAS